MCQGLWQGFQNGFQITRMQTRLSSRNTSSPLLTAGWPIVTLWRRWLQDTWLVLSPHDPLPGPSELCWPYADLIYCQQVVNMIAEWSFPRGYSKNGGISSDLWAISYPLMDDANDANILALGCHTQLIKINIKSAYRMVLIHPLEKHLLGISWGGAAFIDCAIPFGLCMAPNLFTAVVDSIAWALHCQGIRLQIYYLNDFLFFVPPSSTAPAQVLHLAP